MAPSNEFPQSPMPTPISRPGTDKTDADELPAVRIATKIQPDSTSRMINPDPKVPNYANFKARGTANSYWMLPILVLILAFFLASFPARNSDLFQHLASGRML